MARRVLSDASPLIGLARVGGLSWLETLFGRVWVPPEVEREVLLGHKLPDEAALRDAFDRGVLRLCQAVPELPALPELDEDETACIRLALADRSQTLILMDEKAGRAIATGFGLPVAGTAALIGMARSRGLIPSAEAVFARLHASDFRISAPVIRPILQRVGER